MRQRSPTASQAGLTKTQPAGRGRWSFHLISIAKVPSGCCGFHNKRGGLTGMTPAQDQFNELEYPSHEDMLRELGLQPEEKKAFRILPLCIAERQEWRRGSQTLLTFLSTNRTRSNREKIQNRKLNLNPWRLFFVCRWSNTGLCCTIRLGIFKIWLDNVLGKLL